MIENQNLRHAQAAVARPQSAVRLDVMVRNKQPKTQQLQAARTQEDTERFPRALPARMMWRWGISR